MNKTEKFIVAFLLANLALAGALHFLPTVKPAVSVAEKETVKCPDSLAIRADPNDSVSAPATGASGAPTDLSLDQFRRWARQDPNAAWNWASNQSDGDRRVEMLEEFCVQIAEEGDPARAVILADNLQLTNHGTLANLEQQWAQKDLPAAREWVVAKPGGDGKNELLERVAFVWATTDPGNAARFVVDKMSPGNAQTEAAISVLHQWALRDFNGAEAWVELFPEGEIRERAINELAGIREYSMAEAAPGSSSNP